MNYYVLRVPHRKETLALAQSLEFLKNKDSRLIYLTKTAQERRRGKTASVTRPLFPGYLFLETPELDQELYWFIRKQTAVFHFLGEGGSLHKLSDQDLGLLKHFMGYGENIGSSLVKFDINNRIKVVSGPMMGLEGKITRVDRRKKRAKILIELEGNALTIDLPYLVLQKETVGPVSYLDPEVNQG